MSQATPDMEYSGYTFPFDSPEDAGLTERDHSFTPHVVASLRQTGVVKIESPLTADDYREVANTFRACVEECPAALAKTYHPVDRRFGNEAGFVRKERKFNPKTGQQVQDPKNLFHFNEQARARWTEQFRLAPSELRKFLDYGYEIHATLLHVARLAIVDQLETTHPGITEAVFPAGTDSVSFYRHIDYDDYDLDPLTMELPVATRHLDLSWLTLQGHASTAGFYGVDRDGNKHYYDDHNGAAYAFMGISHRKLYGNKASIQPLPHGVDRITKPGDTHIERRQADILFLDPWKIDCKNTGEETKDV